MPKKRGIIKLHRTYTVTLRGKDASGKPRKVIHNPAPSPISSDGEDHIGLHFGESSSSSSGYGHIKSDGHFLQPADSDTASTDFGNLNESTVNPGNKTTWQKVKERREKNWREIRNVLVDFTIQNMSPPSSVCCICKKTERHIIRCLDCGPQALFCHDCYSPAHKHTRLHYPEVWKDFIFVPYEANLGCWSRGDGHQCGAITKKKIQAIDRNGRSHYIEVEVCPCEDDLVTLLRHQLWAASPKEPTVAIHLDLMEWGLMLQLEAHVSTQKFIDAVAARGNVNSPQRLTMVYRAIIRDCVDEYSYFKHQLKASANVTSLSTIDDGTLCPPCHGDMAQAKVVCIDGNFGLVRKRAAGSSSAPPKLQGQYFIQQSAVDAFVADKISITSRNVQSCSDFQAGSTLRSKGKTMKLDEKGVLGSACRHDIPLLFCNLKHGERFAYPVYLLQEIMKLPQFSQAEKITAVYDVACQFGPHLQVHYPELHGKLQMAIPVFHAYGHKLLCQITKSLRTIVGVGLIDGENLERLWSYLRPFGPMTKEMGPSKRSDLLTNALDHYSRKERIKLGQILRQRLDRALKAEAESKEEVRSLLQPFSGVNMNDDMFEMWSKEDVENLKNASSKTHTAVPAVEEYVLKLSSFYLDTSDFEAERAVRQMEQVHHFSQGDWVPDGALFQETLKAAVFKRREALVQKMHQETLNRKFLITSMEKYGIGQAIANRIGQQISKATKKLRNDIQAYNQFSHVASTSHLPPQLSIEHVLSPESNIFSCFLTSESQTQNHVPLQIKRRVIASMQKYKRAKEEHDLVYKDLNCAISFFCRQHAFVLSAITDLLKADNVIIDAEALEFKHIIGVTSSPGLMSFLFQKLLCIEKETDLLLSRMALEVGFNKPATLFMNVTVQQEPLPVTCNTDEALDFIEDLQLSEADTGLKEVLESVSFLMSP